MSNAFQSSGFQQNAFGAGDIPIVINFDLSNPSFDYVAPSYSIVDVSLKDDKVKFDSTLYSAPVHYNTNFFLLGDYIPPDAGELDVTLSYIFEPDPIECSPDWENQPSRALNISFVSCDDEPDFDATVTTRALRFNFKCCDGEDSGGGEVVPDLILANGNLTFGEVVAEGTALFELTFEARGFYNLLNLTASGTASFVNIPTAGGNVSIGSIIGESVIDRGNQITGDLKFAQVVLSGEALVSPAVFVASGSIVLSMKAEGHAQAFRLLEAEGAPVLRIVVAGVAMTPMYADGFHNEWEVVLAGSAESTLVTVENSNLILDAVIAEGEATYNIVPTAFGDIRFDIVSTGYAVYVEIPTAWGDINLEIKVSTGSTPVITGNHVYWADIPLKIIVEGVVTTPIPIDASDIIFDEIIAEGVAVVAVIGSSVPIDIGKIRVNRGWVEFGEIIPPTAREIYEASTVRSDDIRFYPPDPKYPIYVPTTDYNIQGVELRRGTLDYTVEFLFDAEKVDKVIVWIVDENGNSVPDSIASHIGDTARPHELHQPFKNLYSVAIPIHCVNDKRYNFYLEIIYTNEMFEGVVTFERHSHLIPFQAHFDNRKPYFNSTDKLTTIDGNFGSTKKATLETSSTLFELINQPMQEPETTIHCMSSFKSFFSNDYVILDKIDYVTQDIIQSLGINSGNVFVQTTYVELDIGQIGG